MQWRVVVSRQAIAAVIARPDLASGERLVALSLASFADRENRAWPGAPAAAARAGLRRSRYQEAREELVRRGLVAVEERATGRGRASTITLTFADTGPWWDGGINVELFEAVLGYSHAAGPARLLLATMAAIAGEDGMVRDVSTEQLCGAAGMTDRTYRRARQALLASGELVLETSGLGGRGLRNVWSVPDPRLRDGAEPSRATKRVPPPPGARPLIAATGPSITVSARLEPPDADAKKGGTDRTVSAENCPVGTGVFDLKGGTDRTVSAEKCPVGTGVSAEKGGQDRTLFDEPRQKPRQKPRRPTRARERNPRTPEPRKTPPAPLKGGAPLAR